MPSTRVVQACPDIRSNCTEQYVPEPRVGTEVILGRRSSRLAVRPLSDRHLPSAMAVKYGSKPVLL